MSGNETKDLKERRCENYISRVAAEKDPAKTGHVNGRLTPFVMGGSFGFRAKFVRTPKAKLITTIIGSRNKFNGCASSTIGRGMANS